MAQSPNPSQGNQDVKPGERFRYIGFEVFPGKSDAFWKSESEAQQYVTKVHSGDADALLHREFSLLETQAMGAIDRWILTATGAVMVATTAMPWVSYRTTDGTDYTLSWMSSLSTLLGGIGTAFSSGVAVGLSALLGLSMLIMTPLLGIWILAMVWRKVKSPEAYQLGLRMPLKLAYLGLFAGLAILLLSLFGGDIPGYASWGLIDQPERYGVGALLGILSFGPYSAMAMCMICGVKSGDL